MPKASSSPAGRVIIREFDRARKSIVFAFRKFGMGRVFNIALRHGPEDTESSEFKAVFARGVEWATTGKVTIPVPPELAK